MENKISWSADEFTKHDHGFGWYFGLFLFGGLLIVWSLYTRNLIAVILFVLIVVILYISSNREPEKILIELDDNGILVNGILYRYSELKYFWIFNNPPFVSELHVETNRVLNRKLVFDLNGQDPQLIRNFLKLNMQEREGYEENFIDYLIRRLKI